MKAAGPELHDIIHPSAVTLAGGVAVRLRQYGIQKAFGIPGTHNLELFRALGDQGIEIISAHHEQGLGYAADAYSRVTGRPAVVITTTGPGITNLITALATSAAASVPILAIAPGIPEMGLGKGEGWLHDLPHQVGLMAQVVRSRRALTYSEAITFIDDVMQSWSEARPLPAYLEIPFDRLASPADGLLLHPSVVPTVAPGHEELQPILARAADFLVSARSPLIVVGRGGTNQLAATALLEIAERLQAPVVTTANAKGLIDEVHPLSLGVSLRVDAGQALIAKADAILVVGSDLGRSEFWGPCTVLGSSTVRVDVDEQGMKANLNPAIELLGRSERVMPELSAAIAARSEARETSWAADEVEPVLQGMQVFGEEYRVFHQHLQQCCDSLDIAVTGDSSQASYFGTATYWRASRPNRFLYPAGYGTLGYAVPAAIGAQLTGEVERTIAITGEGGLLFSVQELATVAEFELPILTVVFTNGGYQEIREGMDGSGIERVGVDFATPDFVKLAEGFHMKAKRVAADGCEELEFRSALEWALRLQQPSLIEVNLRSSES